MNESVALKKKVDWIIIFVFAYYSISFVIVPLVFYPLSIDLANYIMAVDYGVLAFLVWHERNNLTDFHIDRFSILIFLLCGSILRNPLLDFRASSVISLFVTLITSIFLYIHIKKEYYELPKINLRNIQWVFLGAVTGVIVFLLNDIKYLSFIQNLWVTNFPKNSFINNLSMYVMGFNYELSRAAIPQEFIIRGIIWGYLSKAGWNNIWILIFQTFLFWIGHLFYLTSQPSFLFPGIAISGLVLGLLILKTRSLSASLVSHATYNSILEFITFLGNQ